ncbi:MAG: hypothetical protein MJH11_08040 [Lentisphaeria bacterium]|nr:hypothetical protein [Lentisphaeria bacterium]
MPNLLYVTSEALDKLREHKSYQFWAPIMQNFPIRHVALDERAFYARDIKPKEHGIYITVDMKFVYCRDKLFSFLYDNQDMSFRLSAKSGILETSDGNQFTALLGEVAEVVSTSGIELINEDKVFHPLFDGVLAIAAPEAASGADLDEAVPADKPKRRKSSAKKKAAEKEEKDNEKVAPVKKAKAAAKAAPAKKAKAAPAKKAKASAKKAPAKKAAKKKK